MTMEYVLDASAAVKSFARETESGAYVAWMRSQAEAGALFVAPPLLPFEVRHAACTAWRAGMLASRTEALLAAEEAVAGVELQPVPPAQEMDYAFRLRLSTYDACYAVLAAAGRPLVTYDARLAEAVETAIMPGRA